jgi:peptide/nickel transport system substrate-binding protein
MRYRFVRSTAALAAGGLALCLVSAGCSSSGGSSSGKGAAVASLPAQNINAVPYAQVKSGGTLRLSMTSYPSQFNFNQVNGVTTAVSGIMSALMPTPFLTDAAGQPVNDPAYVTSYKVVQADPATKVKQSVTLELNTKAKWSDGQPITAHDYIVQWDALNGSNPKFDPGGTTGFNDIGGVTQGSSPYEVTYTFSTPFGEWASLFGIIFPAEYNATPSAFDNAYLNKIPVTGGPFKLGSLDGSAQTVTVVRDPSFWWRPAKLDKIVFVTLSQSAAVQALANNEIDNYQVTDVSQYDKVKNTPGITARVAQSLYWPDIIFSAKNSVTSDVQVRQALEMSIDRPAIITSEMKGLPVPQIQPLDNHILAPMQVGYKDDSGTYGTYDPTQAEKILTQAGWVPGAGGIRSKAGKQMALTVIIPSGDDTASSIAQLSQEMLAVVGLKLTIQTINSNDYWNDYFNTGNFQMAIFEWDDPPYTISGSQPEYQSPQGGNVFQNPGGIYNPKIDQLFNQALETTNVTQSHALADQADALIWQEGHDLPLYSEPDIEMQKANLANFGAIGMGLPDYTEIGYTS